MSGPKKYGFSAVLVRNKVGKSQILAFSRVRVLGSPLSPGCSNPHVKQAVFCRADYEKGGASWIARYSRFAILAQWTTQNAKPNLQPDNSFKRWFNSLISKCFSTNYHLHCKILVWHRRFFDVLFKTFRLVWSLIRYTNMLCQYFDGRHLYWCRNIKWFESHFNSCNYYALFPHLEKFCLFFLPSFPRSH